MAEKTVNSRIVHKHDVEANWLKAENFYPKQGEIIVYDIDDTNNYERFKIGDGKTLVSDLPFTNDALAADISAVDDKVDAVSALVGDTAVSEQIEAAQIVHVGPTEPTDPNIKVWINTAEEGTGVVPVLPRIATITLAASNWTGNSTPYSQTVNINTVTAATKIDLQPTAAQLVTLQDEDIGLLAENNNGNVTIYAFGAKPSSTMVVQALLQEVSFV